MTCFSLDKSDAVRSGKLGTVMEDRIIEDGLQWYNEPRVNDPVRVLPFIYSLCFADKRI
jgi:hypothetical protein